MSEPRRPGRAHLARRLLWWYAATFVVLMVVFGVVLQKTVTSVMVDSLTARLEAEAELVSAAIDDSDIQGAADRLSATTGSRITVIGPDGTVLADSLEDPTVMENHAARPEMAAALRGEVGTDRRVSETIGDRRLYVAVPHRSGMVVRLSLTERQIDGAVSDVRGTMGRLAFLAGLAGVLLLGLLTRRLVRPFRELTAQAGAMAAGDTTLRPRRSPIREMDQLGLAIGQMARDLGDRARASQDESESLEAILEALPEGIALIEGDRIVYSNQVLEDLLDSDTPARLAGLAPFALQEIVREATLTGEPALCEIPKTGSRPPLRALVTPTGKPEGRSLLVVTDITERLRTESMRRQFVDDASHEMKTPVAGILASVEAARLAMEHDPKRVNEFLSTAEDSARRLSLIVGDLLDLSRLESDELESAPVDFGRIVEDETSHLRKAAAGAGVELNVSIVSATVLGNAAELATIVRNLCENALRFTDRGGSVNVSMEVMGGKVVLVVADTGIGIPSRSLYRVFERFYRVDDARSRATGGTGLGLALVKHAVERHRGSVSVESELGVGSTFKVVLPIKS